MNSESAAPPVQPPEIDLKSIPLEWINFLGNRKPTALLSEILRDLYPMMAAHALKAATKEQWESFLTARVQELLDEHRSQVLGSVETEGLNRIANVFDLWEPTLITLGAKNNLTVFQLYRDLVRSMKGEELKGPGTNEAF